MQRVGRLVEPRNRRVAVLGQLADAVVGLLRQNHARLCPLELGLARSDHLDARANFDIGELRLGDDLRGDRLLVFGQRFRIVDLDEDGASRNILAALDGNCGDATVDARGDIEPRCVHFALHQQRFAPQQIPDRQTSDGDDNQRDDDRRHTIGPPVRLLRRLLRRFLRQFGRDMRFGVSRSHSITPLSFEATDVGPPRSAGLSAKSL